MCGQTDNIKMLQRQLRSASGAEKQDLKDKIINALLDLYIDKISAVNASLDGVEKVLNKYGEGRYAGRKRSNH